ncbi:NAD(P)/FAD-dependent oxidoreductase [Porticoccaceae bacterium]|jgi:phytoene dehydrogenase-like protein|nr:NAD(P)/FAD-dependent oxidoreductase [Porticoccaceae bacterium]MDA8598685.1 NAD(P)/FAD-dependent oxidoreductase [Porticoccaceae bacterium]MDA9583234.1 NAD(P)/FAD-dependent oxidoreductase [Porticoccaceae bacterium]MDB2559144.1 NAD(P)/FAD-dependent oxidoreductase [Porticoccaceae bacterium]|tara:strand:- start:518 stop:2092 length:1575 start_codon:yes stop_codon:yes gene_type:complete
MINVDKKYDVIVVGGGHNGLVCATYLAKAGRKVLVLEANAALGGASATSEFSDQFSVSSCAHWLFQLNPEVASDMGLKGHGLELAARDLNTIALAEDGNHLTIGVNTLEGAGVTDEDRKAFVAFNKQMLKFSKLLSGAFNRRAPKLVEGNLTDRITLAKLGLGMKMLGKTDMSDLMRLALINIYDVMEENFENDLLKAAISLDSLLGSHMGPRSPNTVYGYLYRRMGDIYGFNGPAVVRGGMGAVGEALGNAAKTAGVDIEVSAAVSKINVDVDRATGVTLADGRVVDADMVVSNADPKTTFNKLVGLTNIETGIARRVKSMRMKGDAAKLHIALESLPDFTGLTKDQIGQRLLIAPTMDYIELAFNACKYGEYSKAPAMDISIPTIHDPSLAPDGKHVMSVIVQFAPYELEGGWESHKDNFKNLIIDRIADYAPNLKDKIIASELLTPADLEDRFHIHGGHWHHGEISLDQILTMRPFPGASQYGTSVDGLFLCSAGTHPGGGVMGLAGHNAAKEIIKRGKSA